MKLHFSLLLALTLVCSSCGKKNQTVAEAPLDALVQVGNAWIFPSDLDHLQQTARLPNATLALDRLISEETLAQSALGEGMDRDPSVRAAIRRLLATRYLEKHLSNPPTITDEQVRAEWEASGDRFNVPAAARIAVIRKRFEAGGEEEARQYLMTVLEEYRSTPDRETQKHFGPIAANFSDHQDTRYQGGDCGWVNAGEAHAILPQEVVQRATAQGHPGLLNEVILEDSEAWLILVSEARASTKEPFLNTAPRLRRELESSSTRSARDLLLQTASANIVTTRLQDVEEPAQSMGESHLAASPPSL